jgi:hypothetical protein
LGGSLPTDAAGSLPAVVFLPPTGSSRAERWLAAARVAAAADLLERLADAGYGPLAVAAAEASDRKQLETLGARGVPEAAQ